jgi:hypothetical protein
MSLSWGRVCSLCQCCGGVDGLRVGFERSRHEFNPFIVECHKWRKHTMLRRKWSHQIIDRCPQAPKHGRDGEGKTELETFRRKGLCSARVRRGSRIRTRAVGRARSGSAARARGQEVRGGGERKRRQWHWQLEVEEPSKATAVRGEWWGREESRISILRLLNSRWRGQIHW